MLVIPAVTFSERNRTVGWIFSGSGWISFAADCFTVPSDSLSTAIKFFPAVSFPLPKVTLWLFSLAVTSPE